MSAELHAVCGRLFVSSDDFMIAVANWISYARDGSSRRIIEAVEKALQHAKDVRLLYAYLDPKNERKNV